MHVLLIFIDIDFQTATIKALLGRFGWSKFWYLHMYLFAESGYDLVREHVSVVRMFILLYHVSGFGAPKLHYIEG